VAEQVTAPFGIRTLTPDGALWTNRLGREWSDRVLLAYGGTAGARVTAGDPGATADRLASAAGQLDAVVLRRGVFVATEQGCSLAAEPGAGEPVGNGSCSISEDERWVASWRSGGQGFQIRDLRSDDVRRVGGGPVVGVSPLGRDARVFAAQETADGVAVRIIDATNGDVVADVGRYEAVQVAPSVQGAEGFVALVQRDGARSLVFVDTDGRLTTIARGAGVVPVTYGARVVYLELGVRPGRDRLWRWEPGGEPELLLRGRVGAAAIDPEHVVAMRERNGRVQFFREGPTGMELSVELATDTAQPVAVERTLVQGDEVFLQVAGAAGTSLVVVDTHGGEGRVPARNWPYLAISSVDHDGTVLLAGSQRRSQTERGRDELLVVHPGAERAVVRARVGRVGASLLHDGVIYTTVYVGRTPEIRSLRAEGQPRSEVLLRDRQLVGATWPEQGGATDSVMLTRSLLGGAAAGGGAGGGPAPG
jgi:hypothetical protein